MRDYPDSYLWNDADLEAKLSMIRQARGSFVSRPAILIPAYRSVHWSTVQSLADEMESIARRSAFPVPRVIVAGGSLLPDVREELAAAAVMARSQLVVWIDADMAFATGALLSLLEGARAFYQKPFAEVDVAEGVEGVAAELAVEIARTFFLLGVPYPRRGGGTPALSVEWLQQLSLMDQMHAVENGLRMLVKSMGLGLAVVPGACLGLLQSPLFERTWNAKHGRFDGEDYAFCRRIREAGGSVVADFGIGNVAHVCEEPRDLTWFHAKATPLLEGRVARKIEAGADLRGPKPTHPHQKGGVVDPTDSSWPKGGAS